MNDDERSEMDDERIEKYEFLQPADGWFAFTRSMNDDNTIGGTDMFKIACFAVKNTYTENGILFDSEVVSLIQGSIGLEDAELLSGLEIIVHRDELSYGFWKGLADETYARQVAAHKAWIAKEGEVG